MKGQINLLPQDIIAKRQKEAYFAGLDKLVQRLFLLLVFLLVSEIMVFFAFNHINDQLKQATNTSLENNKVFEQVKQTNNILKEIKKTKEQTTNWSLYIEELLNNAPDGITVQKIETTDEDGKIQIKGFSRSHDTTLEFQNILKQLSWVIHVESPLQNFALGTDAGFTFNLVFQEQEDK